MADEQPNRKLGFSVGAAYTGTIFAFMLFGFVWACKMMTLHEVTSNSARFEKTTKILHVRPVVQSEFFLSIQHFMANSSDVIFDISMAFYAILLVYFVSQVNRQCDPSTGGANARLNCGANTVHEMNFIVFLTRALLFHVVVYSVMDLVEHIMTRDVPEYTKLQAIFATNDVYAVPSTTSVSPTPGAALNGGVVP